MCVLASVVGGKVCLFASVVGGRVCVGQCCRG